MGKEKVIHSSGHVFADLAADQLGIDQPKVSHLLRGQLAGFSTDRLLGFLTAMGRDVEIVVKIPPRSRRRGRMRVVAA